MSLPNKLSVFRIILVLILIIVPYIPQLELLVLGVPLTNSVMAVIFLIVFIFFSPF